MPELYEFRAELNPTDTGGATIRVAPFGETVTSPWGEFAFAPDSLRFPEGPVPFTIDHGRSVLDRVGVVTTPTSTADAMYASVEFADTQTAQDVRELMRSGAVTDVSVGVADFTIENGTMYGTVHHVAAVDNGRFGDAKNPSKVLATHATEEEPPMATDTEIATQVADSPTIAEFTEVVDEVRALRAELNDTRVVEEAPPWATMGHYVQDLFAARAGDTDADRRIAEFAMSADTTTTGAGAVPDYLAAEFLSVLATQRPFTNSIGSRSAGSYGMTVSTPKWGTKPTVTAQSSELDEPSSTTTSVTTLDVDLVTYAGANRVSQQLVRRSSPDFVDQLVRELVSSYNKVTDAAGIAAVHSSATGAHTAVVADLSADAAATFAAFNAANTAIIPDMRRPADTIWLAPDKWAELNSLVDSEGRPLLVYPPNNPVNATGTSSLNTMVAQYHGWRVILVPDAAAATVLIGISDQAKAYQADEGAQLSTVNVDTLSLDVGIMGLYAADADFGDAFYTITES